MAMPGPYPQFDQYPQAGRPYANRPPIPAVVRNAVTAMYVGAALSVVNAIWSVSGGHVSGNTAIANLTGVAGVFGGIVDVCLWVWMAFANRAGNHWARITGTVFFGFASFGVLGSILVLTVLNNAIQTADAANGVNTAPTAGYEGVTVALSAVSWLVGLYATIMMWNKSAADFYRPQMQYGAPGWAPGAPPYGYANPYPNPYPNLPNPYPPAAPLIDQAPLPVVPPSDPWQTPQG
jgi:hypothetical protein